jgi:hypothetical protein
MWPTAAVATPRRVYLHELLCTSTCLSIRALCCTHEHFCLTEPIESGVFWSAKYFSCLFRNRFMFVLVVLTGSKHRNKPRNLCVGFMKQTEKQLKHCKINKSCIDVGKKIICHRSKYILVQYPCKYISGIDKIHPVSIPNTYNK